MSKNFETWFNEEKILEENNIFIRADNKINERYGKKVWDACKEEILEILRQSTPGHQVVYYTAEKEGIIKEIEEL